MITVSKENNILKIDDGVKIKYYNGSWCTMDFTDNAVIITDEGRTVAGESSTIPFSEFQDDQATAYNTESAIATFLSDKIG